jgi:formate dehydrogenase major subunit
MAMQSDGEHGVVRAGDGRGGHAGEASLAPTSPSNGRRPVRRDFSRQPHPRIRDATVSISVCPFCAVGCSQQVFVKDGRIINIEGNPDSPINDGHLCPKGASTYQLIHNPDRPTSVLYRAPKSDHWEEKPLEWAMERIAERVKATRDAEFQMRGADGARVNRLESIAHIGGATLDNEENYLILKLFRNLGIVHITNQARI